MRHRTDIEIIMAEALEREGIEAVEQFPIRGRFGYVLDFAIPEKKIDIECDGEHFHKEGNSRDRKRNWVLRNRGWKILRFTGTQIKEDINSCITKIKQEIR
jgi:very-short-patch-repair endonuclease